jgi:RND family efflux transporter MFP subunit
MILHRHLIFLCFVSSVYAQAPVDVIPVQVKAVDREIMLPGEIRAFLDIPIYAKVTGFAKKVNVDRGSLVKEGDVLVTLEAPEMQAQIVEAQSKVRAIRLRRAEAEAKLASAQSTYDSLEGASATPGVVAGNDLVVAEKAVEAARAVANAYQGTLEAAEASVRSLKDLEQYLTVTAPFDGVIIEREVHPGALVGPNSGASAIPLLRLQQTSRLRLTVAVPEAVVAGIMDGAQVPFTLPAFPGETFHGSIARIAHSLDDKTRTMAVEVDVSNPALRLAPGMYPEVRWPVRSAKPALLVLPTSIVTTTEQTFVIRVKDGMVEWVPVQRGPAVGNLVEVYGNLRRGDLLARRGTDELRAGSRVHIRAANVVPSQGTQQPR